MGRGRHGAAGRAFTRDGPAAPAAIGVREGRSRGGLGAAIPIPGLARGTPGHVGASDPPRCSGHIMS